MDLILYGLDAISRIGMVRQKLRDPRFRAAFRFQFLKELSHGQWIVPGLGHCLCAVVIGFAFMPEYSVTLAGLLVRPLLEPEVRRDVVLATMPGRPHSPAVAAFMRAARGFSWPG